MILKFLKTSLRFKEQIILWPENKREQKKIRLFNLEKKLGTLKIQKHLKKRRIRKAVFAECLYFTKHLT